MKRLWVLLAVLLVATGCKGSGTSSPAVDPFFGRTRIEPPRTGAVGGNTSAGGNLSQGAPAASSLSGGAPRPLPGGSSGSSFAPSLGQPSASSGNWAPAQTKTNPVPAAIPGSPGGGQNPTSGGIGSGNNGGFSSPTPTRPLSGNGDRISIPLAARSEPAWPRDTGTSPSPSSTSGTSPANTASPTENLSVRGGTSAGPNVSGTATAANPAAQPQRPYLDPGSPSSLEGKERIVREIERTASAPSMAPRYAPYPGSNHSTSGGNSSPPAADKGVNIADLPESK